MELTRASILLVKLLARGTRFIVAEILVVYSDKHRFELVLQE